MLNQYFLPIILDWFIQLCYFCRWWFI